MVWNGGEGNSRVILGRVGRWAVPAVAVAAALAGCSSGGHSAAQGGSGATGTSTTVAATAAKTTLCSAVTTIDKAQDHVTTGAQELQMLRANSSAVSGLGSAAAKLSDPTVAAAADQMHAAIAKAMSTGTANFTPAVRQQAGTVDAFCGVQPTGAPLPSYFAAGKSLPACIRYSALNTQLQDATSSQQYLSLIQSARSQIASMVSQAPPTIKNEATKLGAAAQAAISQKSLAPLQTASAGQATADVQLYCGIDY